MKKLFYVLVAVMALASCASKKTASVVLTGDWKVIQLGTQPVDSMGDFAYPELSFFEDGKYHAYAGCNQINGNFQLEGNTLTWGEALSTKMFCEDVMELEDALVLLLQGKQTLEEQGDHVLLLNEADEVVLRLKK